MMIPRISGYTPTRQAQKVNFGDIKVDDWVKEHCELTDEDISKLNSKCPENFDVDVYWLKVKPFDYVDIACANVSYNGKLCHSEEFDIYCRKKHSKRTKKGNKNNFVECINKILKLKGKVYTQNSISNIILKKHFLDNKLRDTSLNPNDRIEITREQKYLKDILREIKTTGKAIRVE